MATVRAEWRKENSRVVKGLGAVKWGWVKDGVNHV